MLCYEVVLISSIFLTKSDSNKLHGWFLKNSHCQAAIKVNNVLFDSSSKYLDASYFQKLVISSTIQKCWSLLLVTFQGLWMLLQSIVVTHFSVQSSVGSGIYTSGKHYTDVKGTYLIDLFIFEGRGEGFFRTPLRAWRILLSDSSPASLRPLWSFWPWGIGHTLFSCQTLIILGWGSLPSTAKHEKYGNMTQQNRAPLGSIFIKYSRIAISHIWVIFPFFSFWPAFCAWNSNVFLSVDYRWHCFNNSEGNSWEYACVGVMVMWKIWIFCVTLFIRLMK